MTENTLLHATFSKVHEALEFAAEHEGQLSENLDGSWTVDYYAMQGEESCPPNP